MPTNDEDAPCTLCGKRPWVYSLEVEWENGQVRVYYGCEEHFSGLMRWHAAMLEVDRLWGTPAGLV